MGKKSESKRGKRSSGQDAPVKIKRNKDKYNNKKRKAPAEEKTDLSPSKKRKRADDDDEPPVETKKRKKEKKAPKEEKPNKTGFPNPVRDKSLPDQSRKVLGYAFERFRDPSHWKFNKSRQNWLIRNVWNFQSVPDAHMPLALKYLETIQGYSRDNVLKKCNTILETVPAPAEESKAADASPSKKPPTQIRLERARAILGAVSSTKSKQDTQSEEKKDAEASHSSSDESSDDEDKSSSSSSDSSDSES